LKKEIDDALANVEKNVSDEIECKFKEINGNVVHFTVKFEMEDDAHEFTIEVSDKYLKGDKSENLVFSTNDEELDDWLQHMVEFSSTCQDLGKGLLECAKFYFDMENEGDDDEDVDNYLDDDDIFGEPGTGIEIAPKPSSSNSNQPRLKSEDFFTGDGSKAATERLIKDLQAVSGEEMKTFGFEVEPIDDNLYKWEARLFGFEGDLAKDMKKHSKKFVKMELTFPKDYPFAPPFIRVVEPRFKFHTGHVTIGGSICTEVLTRSGWTPTNSVESVLVQIRAEMMAGGARLDTGNQRPYSLSEAQSAFDRVARQHGWHK